MNIVILCDSKFGNTRKLAEAMQTALAEGNTVHLRSADEGVGPTVGIDLLLVGGPTQAHGASSPLKAALDATPAQALRGTRAATFDTRFHLSRVLTGSAAGIADRMLKRAGATMLAGPESFFVTREDPPILESGELQRAATWAKHLVG